MKSVLCYKRLCGMFYYTTVWCLFAGYLMHIFLSNCFHSPWNQFVFQTSVIIFYFNN